MTYKKVGGLRFVRIGRFGMSFFWSRNINAAAERRARRALRTIERRIDELPLDYFAR
jgi:hypothetical protein